MNTIKALIFFSPIEVEPRYESVNGVPHLKIINIVLASHLREIFDQTSMPAVILIVHQSHEDSPDTSSLDFQQISDQECKQESGIPIMDLVTK